MNCCLLCYLRSTLMYLYMMYSVKPIIWSVCPSLPPPKSGMPQMPACVLFEMGKKAEEMLPKILNGI